LCRENKQEKRFLLSDPNLRRKRRRKRRQGRRESEALVKEANIKATISVQECMRSPQRMGFNYKVTQHSSVGAPRVYREQCNAKPAPH